LLAEQSALLTKEDKQIILGQLEILFSQIYEPYKEFEEVRKMKDDIILSTGEKMVMKAELDKSLKIARNMLNTGISPEKAAKIAELPLRKVKALLKTTVKMKQSA
jgi:hypothetical protein